MAPLPLLATKLHRPRLAAPLVARPRLLVHLTAGLEQGLLLISAPAGYGKSTVVNQWLDTVDLPWAWVALDEIQSLDVHAVMRRVLQHRPVHIHLALTTRADPPLSLERLRGQRQLRELRGADLRFTLKEAAQLLRQQLGTAADDETTALLEAGTEGWAVGLHLAALSLRGQNNPAAFARKIAQSGHQSMLDYLLAEVLQGLPDDQRAVLLQTALLDRFCAPLIDAIQGENGAALPGADFVAELGRANLFLTPLDDQGAWYRYHHLFQQLLRNRLRQAYGEVEIRTMHARASAWFAREGLLDEAIVHALLAEDPRQAASLVECHIHKALDREDWRHLERWIGLLPAELLGRPRLLLAQAWLSFIRYQLPAIKTGSLSRIDPLTGLDTLESVHLMRSAQPQPATRPTFAGQF